MPEPTARLTELLDELDGQLAAALRLSGNRAEHLRLVQLQSTALRLRAEVAIAQAPELAQAS